MLVGGMTAVSLVSAVLICYYSGCFAGFWWIPVLPLSFLGCFALLFLLAFLFLYVSAQVVDLEKPQEEDSKFYRWIAKVYSAAITTLVQARVHTVGLERTPRDGRFLLVCNHLDIMDPVLLLHFFDKSQLAFISKKENKHMFIVGGLMHKLQAQLIDRENDRAALRTILKCISMLKEDKASIAVFPEGYISQDEKLHKFRSGVFKIAQKAGVPIVVCTITNTRHLLKRAARLKPTHIELHLVDVIPAQELKGVTTVEIAERVHSLMAADLGPDRVLQE